MLTFTEPLMLLLIPCCIAYFFFFVLLARFRRADKQTVKAASPPGQFWIAAIRSIVAILLILALSGARIRTGSDAVSTIFAIDSSASMNGTMDQIIDFLIEAEMDQKENDITGAVLFGEKAAVAANTGHDGISGSVSGIRVPDGLTNIEEALRLSQTLLLEEAKKRITIISDGLENAGDALTAAKLLSKKEIIIDVFHLMPELSAEIQLNEIRVPRYLRAGIKNDIEVRGWSATENAGRLLVYRNDELIADNTVSIRKGENKFVFTDTIPDESGGGIIYRAEIVPINDTYADNNTVFAYSYAEGRPSILAVGNNGSEKEIVNILQAGSGMGITVKSPSELVMSQEELNIYDAVILANIPADDLPEGFVDILESYVRNHSGGLVVSGGDNSFGLGDYENTLLETVLPVEMKLTDEEEAPDIGMVIVLDRSGSMSGGNYGISKLEMAKEAVIRSIDTLSDQDSIGILTFDDQFYWTVEYVKSTGSREKIKNSVAEISPGGGTSILPALREAYTVLEPMDAKVKHIVLLTDGQAERYGYDLLIESMRQSGITLSTIAVGSDSDTVLLEYLALSGNGRYYFTNEFTDLPKIFSKETKMAGRRYLNDDQFFPTMGQFHEILSGINALPSLVGYVSTTAKPRADAVLLSERGEPVLAAWQYGLGRTVAWTSDMDGNWSREWLKNETSVTVFRNMISWVVKSHQESDLRLELNMAGGNAEIKLTLPYGETIKRIRAAVIDPEKNETEIEFKATAPGIFSGILPSPTVGAYMAAITVEDEAEDTVYTEGFCVPYSAELDMRGREKGFELLSKLASATGGRVLIPGDDVFASIGGTVYNDKNISDLLIILSLILFLVDIFVRRFPVFRRKIESIPKTSSRQVPDFKFKSAPQNVGTDPKTDDTRNTTSSLISQKKKRLNIK